jgi:SAM-dependent methyltransferase
MSITKSVRDAGSVAISRATWGGSQNFLGARWVELLLLASPGRSRERLALRLLSLSPHYFYDRNIRAEAERNRRSRQALADALILPHVTPGDRVLDYGCGPGYMARAVAQRVGHVDAIDISRGVLACAKVLNSSPNITYWTPGKLGLAPGTVDVAYSFAVVQHLRTNALIGMLGILADKVRQDGVLLLHFAVSDEETWLTESEWTARVSIGNRIKLRYGLNCFGRSAAELASLVMSSGFTDVVVEPLSGSITVPGGDDIVTQHWLTARRQ